MPSSATLPQPRALSRTGSFSSAHSDDAPQPLISPGECFTVQASAATLRQQLTDSYWCDTMEEICDGKQVGVAVRYTGEDLVLLQFRSAKPSPAGYRYPFFITIPRQYLVPVKLRRHNSGESPITITTPGSPLMDFASSASHQGATTLTPSQSPFCTDFGDARQSFISSKTINSPAPETPHLCVVCGRFDAPGQVRRHGFKCNECVGKKSNERLRGESMRLKNDDMTTFQKQTMEFY